MMLSHDVDRETFPPEYIQDYRWKSSLVSSGANKQDQFWASHISCLWVGGSDNQSHHMTMCDLLTLPLTHEGWLGRLEKSVTLMKQFRSMVLTKGIELVPNETRTCFRGAESYHSQAAA